MDYQNLFIFTKVLERGSFLAAAKALQMPTSTVSRRIQQLESQLGYQLLHRSSRKLVLTEAGEKFFRRSQPLFAELEQITQAVDVEMTSPTGELRITAPVTLGSELLKPWFFRFMELYPNIELDLLLVNRNIDLVEEGIDVAFRIGDVHLKDWISRPLFHSEFIICASPGLLDRLGEPEQPQQLLDYPRVVARNTAQWQLRNDDGCELTIAGPTRMRADELRTAADAVIAGLGVGNLPGYVVAESIRQGRLQRILPDWTPQGRQVQMLYPHRKYVPRKVRLFIEFVLKQVESFRVEQP